MKTTTEPIAYSTQDFEETNKADIDMNLLSKTDRQTYRQTDRQDNFIYNMY